MTQSQSWKQRNPEKVKEIQRRSKRKHYYLNRDEALQRARDWRANNREKVRELNKKWIEDNKEHHTEWRLGYRERNKEKFKEYDRQRWLRDKQAQDESATRPRPELCEFGCGRGPVVYDHDHDTMEFRSWPCKECNSVMGLVYDRSDILRKMADVIDAHKAEHGH